MTGVVGARVTFNDDELERRETALGALAAFYLRNRFLVRL